MAKTRARQVAVRSTTRPQPKAGPGRPPVHNETWSKVSVVLFDRQIVQLDRLAIAIRGKTGKVINRAEIIRALIDGLIDSEMDVTATSSEADLRARVSRRLGTPYR
jgi:predicted thioredoxin/glutaredoxin